MAPVRKYAMIECTRDGLKRREKFMPQRVQKLIYDDIEFALLYNLDKSLGAAERIGLTFSKNLLKHALRSAINDGEGPEGYSPDAEDVKLAKARAIPADNGSEEDSLRRLILLRVAKDIAERTPAETAHKDFDDVIAMVKRVPADRAKYGIAIAEQLKVIKDEIGIPGRQTRAFSFLRALNI